MAFRHIKRPDEPCVLEAPPEAAKYPPELRQCVARENLGATPRRRYEMRISDSEAMIMGPSEAMEIVYNTFCAYGYRGSTKDFLTHVQTNRQQFDHYTYFWIDERDEENSYFERLISSGPPPIREGPLGRYLSKMEV